MESIECTCEYKCDTYHFHKYRRNIFLKVNNIRHNYVNFRNNNRRKSGQIKPS